MTSDLETEQEAFWQGEFGDHYIDRNRDFDAIARKTNMMSRILERTRGVQSALEFGANIGLNLRALRAP